MAMYCSECVSAVSKDVSFQLSCVSTSDQTEVPGGRTSAHMTSSSVATAALVYLIPSLMNPPLVYHVTTALPHQRDVFKIQYDPIEMTLDVHTIM